MLKKNRAIDYYHQNMFDFDCPNVSWVKSCTEYLNSIFPNGLKNKRVIDYGFGRGNWSLAFLSLGAEHVTAIDASNKAVERFSQYAKDNCIENLSIQLGNTDENFLDIQADVVFLYGILQHVKKPLNLLEAARGMCIAPNSQVVIYAYNADSLRQTVVEIGRAAVDSTPNVLREFNLTLHPDARIRAMDDLTAPSVNFWTNIELEKMFQKTGLNPISQLTDFAAFEDKTHAPEFEPYLFITSPLHKGSIRTVPQCSPNLLDLEHIKFLAIAILKILKKNERTQFAIGLFNTSFAVQGAELYFERVFAIWRYLVISGLSNGLRLQAEILPAKTRSLFNATYQRYTFPELSPETIGYSDPDLSLSSFIARGRFRL